MFDSTSVAVEWFAVGALLVALGALIKFRQWTFLIAGYDRTSSVPEEVAADLVGNTVLRIGVAAGVIGAFVTFTSAPSYLGTIFEVVVLVAVARLLYRLHTYTPNGAA
jgi:hypothetical protein